MPTTIDAAGLRKVRCPKCTAVLTEPQTQIYECPICLTLLLAKGNSGNKLWENRVHKSDGGADDIQQALKGGSKLEKAILINESSKIQVQQSNTNVSNVGFDGRSRTSQEGHVLSDLDNQSLSGISFSKLTTEPVNDLAPKNNALAPDTPPDTPQRRKSRHVGEILSQGGSGQRSSELDSASHSESEVDSSLWSSENANIGEVPEVPSMVSSFEASSLVAGSSEHLTTSKPSLLSGAAGNNNTKSLQEESELGMRNPLDAKSSARCAEEEIEREERHHPHEVAHEERQYLESRVRNPDVSVITSSGKYIPEEGHKAKDKTDDDSSNSLTGSTGFQSPQRNLVNTTPKEGVSTDSKQQKDVEISNVGKFGLVDLSVFGIYNEDTYSELRRGKAAHYSKLSGSSSDGEGVRSAVDGDPVSHSCGVATQNSSFEQDRAGNCMVENIAEVQKISGIPESITDGTHIEAGSYGEVPFKDREQDMDARSSSSVGQEVDDGGTVSVDLDSDTLANARYGDHLAVRDLSVEMGSSVDISFGDWRLQQVVKPPQTYVVDSDSVYERGMADVAAGEGSDSSWDDEEELTFASTSKESSKLEGTSGTDKGAQASHSTRRSIGRSQAKTLLENPAFPFRTTAMQKFLQRNDQEGIVQTHSQESIEADSKLYEASYMEHYTPPLENNVHEAADQRTILMPESNADDTLYIEEDKLQMVPVQEELVGTETQVTECQHEKPSSAHSMHIPNVDNESVPTTPFSGEEEDVQDAQSRRNLAMSEETVPLPALNRKEKDVRMAIAEDTESRKGLDAVRSPQTDVRVDEADRPGMEVTDLNLQNVDYFKHDPANKVGSAPGKPASLKWKGKGSSTQSLSSTEDDGAYGMESEAGSGPDRDSTKKQGVGLTERHFLPNREAQFGLGQLTRGHYQPAQRTWLSNIDVDRQKHGSGELTGSRRSARSRAANARLSNQELFEQADPGRISNLETFGRSGLGTSENVPALQSPAVKLNRSMLDQGSKHSYNGTTDYNSDHSSRSQDVPSRSRYNETYLSNPYGLPVAGSTQAYPLSSHGSVPQAPLQEPGFTHSAHHSAHHCVSPACSLCMQQQYYMQPPQMIQNVMMHPCAACASQSSATGYHQPLHHGAHSHHMHGSTYLNPSLRQHGSGSLPAHSQRQNRSNIHQSHQLPLTRRPKLYPPLPGKDAPPYVLCKHCNQLLQVPGYLPPISEPIRKLQCGSCEKISKFTIHLQALSPPAERTLWATSGGLAMHASDNYVARDKRRTDTTSIHSSDWIPSSGLAIPAQNSYGMIGHTPGHGSQQERLENQMFLQSSASGTPRTENPGLRHHARPMTGGVSEQYRSYGRRVEGEHPHNNTGAYSEGYLSSSPSSPSGSSSGKPPQISRRHQQVEPVRQRIPGFGERKLTSDSPALTTTIHDQGRPLFEAPSFSDGFFQKGPIENRSRYSSTSLQGSVHDAYSDSPRNEHLDSLQQASKAGSWNNQPSDTDYSSRSAGRSGMEHLRKLPAAPGSPLIEHFTQDADDLSPTLQPGHILQNSGNGSRSAPWSPGSGSPLSPLVDSFTQDALTDFGERLPERERPPLPAQDASKGSKPFAGLFKRSMKGGQGGNNRRKVFVNGHLISEAAVRKAEELAGPIHSGSYWYDYQAGFWGVMGGPCLGILMPFIEEFHFPLARDCAGGTTGILVNGRELHERDLEVLVKRGMPTMSRKAYTLDISGALFDDVSGQPLKGLGKLAPSIEKKGRGFGMSQFTAV